MRVEPVVNNADELFMANMTQTNKIKYLQSQKSKRESYIRDLQQSLKINKEIVSILASEKKEDGIHKVNEENILLHKKLKQYYEDYMNMKAQLLIEQQLRVEEKKFYFERILDFETNMIQLRKYLQDKEQSFSTVVNRLKKYEDLSEVTLETKLHKFSKDFNQDSLSENIKKITQQRDRYKTVVQKLNIDFDDLTFLKSCLEKKQDYESMLLAYTKYKQKEKQTVVKEEKGISFYEKTKNTTSASNTFHKNEISPPIPSTHISNPNKQLIKLLKKEKLNNEILQEALNQAIEKNQQLLLQNSILANANSELEIRIQKLESKRHLLEKYFIEQHQKENWKKEWESQLSDGRKKGKKMQYHEKEDEEKTIYLGAIEQDMQKLSSFIMTCIPKGKMIKSSSNPNLSRPIEDPIQEGEDIEIQQI